MARDLHPTEFFIKAALLANTGTVAVMKKMLPFAMNGEGIPSEHLKQFLQELAEYNIPIPQFMMENGMGNQSPVKMASPDFDLSDFIQNALRAEMK